MKMFNTYLIPKKDLTMFFYLGDITKPLSGKSTSVYVMIPQPKTNVDWFRFKNLFFFYL